MNNYSRIHKISQNYSKSLYDLAHEKGVVEKVYNNFSDFINLCNSSKEFSNIIKDKIINADIKSNVAQKILKKLNSEDIFIKFVLYVIKNDRLNTINYIFKSFENQINLHNNVLAVKVESSSELKKSDEKVILTTLENRYNKKIKLEKSVNESLIGGFKIQIGSDLIDASLINNMKMLKERSEKHINNLLN